MKIGRFVISLLIAGILIISGLYYPAAGSEHDEQVIEPAAVCGVDHGDRDEAVSVPFHLGRQFFIARLRVPKGDRGRTRHRRPLDPRAIHKPQ